MPANRPPRVPTRPPPIIKSVISQPPPLPPPQPEEPPLQSASDHWMQKPVGKRALAVMAAVLVAFFLLIGLIVAKRWMDVSQLPSQPAPPVAQPTPAPPAPTPTPAPPVPDPQPAPQPAPKPLPAPAPTVEPHHWHDDSEADRLNRHELHHLEHEQEQQN